MKSIEQQLVEKYNGDRDYIALELIAMMASENADMELFNIIDRTGDYPYTYDTFWKAADLILQPYLN